MKITSRRLKKLDDRAVAVIYLDTEIGTKAYRLYDPNSGKIHVSRDVRFDEDRPWVFDSQGTTSRSTSAGTTTSTMSTTCTFTVEGEDPLVRDTFVTQSDGSSEASQCQEEGNNSSFNSPMLQTPVNQPDSTPTTPSTFVGSSERNNEDSHQSSSSSSDGAPKRYRLLSDIYEEIERIEFDEDLLLLGMEEPTTFSEASNDGNWRKAMENEIEAIERNGTWKLTSLPP